MRQYRIQSTALYRLFVAAVPIFSVAAGGFVIWTAATEPELGPLVWFAVAWFAFMLYGCYQMVTMPHTIEVTDAGMIRFGGTFKTTVVAPLGVVSVKASGAFVQLKHAKGKIVMLHQFTGFHEFVTELKQRNGSVRLRGV